MLRRSNCPMPQATGPVARFFERFAGRTVIVHSGLDIDWVAELFTLGGGGGHLRFDVRQIPSSRPQPLERVVTDALLPLALPLPLLLKIGPKAILVRHLIRDGVICPPDNLAWISEEIDDRFHVALRLAGNRLHHIRGIPLDDNDIHVLPTGPL